MSDVKEQADVKELRASSLVSAADAALVEKIKKEILQGVKEEIAKQVGMFTVARKVVEELKLEDDIEVTTKGFPDEGGSAAWKKEKTLKDVYDTLTALPKSIHITFDERGVPLIQYRGFFRSQESRNASNALLLAHRKHQVHVLSFLETLCTKE